MLEPGRAKGGFAGLQAAARESGNVRLLGLEALIRIEVRQCFRSMMVSLGFRSEGPGRDVLLHAIGSLNRATAGVCALGERFCVTARFDAGHLLAVSTQMEQAAAAVKQALRSDVLSHATAGDVRELSRAYAGYLAAYGQYRPTFDEIAAARTPAEVPARTIVWLGKRADPVDSDPAVRQLARALAGARRLSALNDLFVTRRASYLLEAPIQPAPFDPFPPPEARSGAGSRAHSYS